MTSRETPSISIELHANMSLLHWWKSMSSLFYLGSRLAPCYTVLPRSPTSICRALAFVRLESAGHRGHHWAERSYGQPEAKLP
jgi:hypothetical protein